MTDHSIIIGSWRTTLFWSSFFYFSWKHFLVNLGLFSSLVFRLMCACDSLVQCFPVFVEGNFILCVTEAKGMNSSLNSFSPIANLSANHTVCTLIIIQNLNISHHLHLPFWPKSLHLYSGLLQ